MLVKDIYGEKSPFKELQGEWLASSFAKITNQENISDVKKEDIIRSLMCMISFNIGQLAYFSAQLNDVDDIYFVGSFIRNNPYGKE